MIQCVLVDNGEFKIVLEYAEDVDYYTNVFIRIIMPSRELTIYKDNFLALRNILLNFKILDLVNYRENDLGILLNEYYKNVFEVEVEDLYDIANNELEKYCIHVDMLYATWIYRYNQKFVLSVTPMVGGLNEKGYDERYSNFVSNYRVLFKENISLVDLKKAKKIIIDLYNKLF